jgi:hypothetical protein
MPILQLLSTDAAGENPKEAAAPLVEAAPVVMSEVAQTPVQAAGPPVEAAPGVPSEVAQEPAKSAEEMPGGSAANLALDVSTADLAETQVEETQAYSTQKT